MERETVELQPGASQMVATLACKHGMSVTAAFRELIDNSLDAGAKTIWIKYQRAKRRLVIADDGKGTDDVELIVTPYKHRDHDTTLSGRYGIGGTVSMYYLTEGRGTLSVKSITHRQVSDVDVNLDRIRETDRWGASIKKMANDGISTGTEILLSGCREINRQHVGSAHRELGFTFAPAMRKGVQVVFEVDGNQQAWRAYVPPERVARQQINIDVDGHAVKGFCDLLKPGQANFCQGWAVEFGHRFIGKFTDPAGDRTADLGLIYSEVRLPRTWTNINDHKDGFVEPPARLWELLAEACDPILKRAEQQGRTIELNESSRVAQGLLDMAVGYDGPPVKGRRPGKADKEGTAEPTGEGSPHQKFSAVQPGNKPASGRPHASPRRIFINWASNLETSYVVRVEANRVRILLNVDRPEMQMFRGADSGNFLASWVMLAVAADWKCRPENYLAMFPDSEADEIPRMFDLMQSKVRRDAGTTAA